MPNWCSTTITIWDEKEEELANFVKLLNEWTSKDYMENGFGNKWLGNIVIGSGIGTVDTGKDTDIRCRGTMDYVSKYTEGVDNITIETETAWRPLLGMWVKLQEKYFPNGEFTYIAEEPGDELYATNDDGVIGTWAIDSWRNDIETNYDADKNDVVEILQELLKTTESDVYKLQKMLLESDIEDVAVHEYEHLDISEFL